MADWTKETVKYDLKHIEYQSVKEGKLRPCPERWRMWWDNYTVLALLRAVGIPGRFISGIAYTESKEFPKNWGAHGWAEVYFPGTGWVPFDVTYGEYGYVDPTHISWKNRWTAAKAMSVMSGLDTG